MTWNVQNLFDGKDDGTEYNEFDPGKGKWDERLYLRRLDRTGEVILQAVRNGADFVVLQELENSAVLDDLVSTVLVGKGYRSKVIIPGYGIIRVGVLSRYPVRSVHVLESGYYGNRVLRPSVAVNVELPGATVTAVMVHWKSPRGGVAATESARFRQASTVAQFARDILENKPDAKLLILGDLNTSGEDSYRPAALAPWEPGMKADGVALYNTQWQDRAGIYDELPVYYDPEPSEGPPGTYWYNNKWNRPDRALLSPGLLDSSALIFEYCRTWAGFMVTASGQPQPWNSLSEEGYSDHLPLILSFRLRRD